MDNIVEFEKDLQNKLLVRWTAKGERKFIIHYGPTNSGKTYNAIEELKKSKNGIYLSPLRLLAWEVADKINNSGIACSLITGEERNIIPNAQIVSSTIEMCNFQKHYDVVVIDECFMIADQQRGKFWFNTLLNISANEIHVISNVESLNLLKFIITKVSDNIIINQYVRKVPLKVLDEKLTLKNMPKKSIMVCFSRISVLYYKFVFEQLGKKCAVLYGMLPPEVKKEQIKRFVDGEVDYLVSTDVIGMGINLPCDYVVFIEHQKFDGEIMRNITEKEIKQIGGRAGRYLLSDCGYIGTTVELYTPELEYAMQSNINETEFFYGLDEEIYLSIPEKKPFDKIKYYSKIKEIPEIFSKNGKKENLEQYLELSNNYELKFLDDKIAWGFISCPVNKLNKRFWETLVSFAVHQKSLYFDYRYNLEEITTLRELSMAEQDIAVIDLYLYVYNSKYFRSYFQENQKDLVIAVHQHKQIIIDNINNFLLNKKIKEKEITKFAYL